MINVRLGSLLSLSVSLAQGLLTATTGHWRFSLLALGKVVFNQLMNRYKRVFDFLPDLANSGVVSPGTLRESSSVSIPMVDLRHTGMACGSPPAATWTFIPVHLASPTCSKTITCSGPVLVSWPSTGSLVKLWRYARLQNVTAGPTGLNLSLERALCILPFAESPIKIRVF